MNYYKESDIQDVADYIINIIATLNYRKYNKTTEFIVVIETGMLH